MPNASSPKRNKPGRTQTPASPAGVLSSESVANLSTVGVLAAATAVAAVLLGLYTTSRPTTARLPPPSVPPLPVRCLDAVTTGVLACSGQLGLPGAGGPLDMCLNELDENLGLDPGAWASLAAAAGTGIGAAGRDARAKGVSAVLAGLGLTNTRGNLGRGPATSGGRALDPVMGLLQCFGLISGSGAPIRPPASLPPGIAIGVGTLQITAELAIQLPKHGKTDLAAAGVMVSRKNLGRLIERAMPQLGRPGAAMGHMLRGFTATAARKKTSRSKATQELDASYLAAVLAMAGHYPLEIVKVLVSTAAAAVSDGGEHALRWLGSTCGIGDGLLQLSGLVTIPAAAARELFLQCLEAQEVLGPALAAARRAGAVAFGQNWSPVHQAAFYGNRQLLDAVLNAEAASPAPGRRPSRNSLSPLQVAAVNGWVDLVAPLVGRGDNPLVVTPGGKSALDVACLQQWTKLELIQAFGSALATACLEKRSSEPGTDQTPRWKSGSQANMSNRICSDDHDDCWRAGGWLEPPSVCGFHVVDAHNFSGFVENFVALRRPLLMRGADKSSAHTRLKKLWSRSTVAASHPDVRLHPSTIPFPKAYSNAVGQTSAVTVAEYLVYLDKLDRAQRAINASSALEAAAAAANGAPEYVFVSLNDQLSRNSSLHRAIASSTPAVLRDPRIHRRLSPQFYLGPIGAGAPMHYHNHAINALVHGRKRWYVLPPRHAIYSKEPIANWLGRQANGDSDASLRHALECIQEPGDLVYIPASWAHGVLNLAESVGFAIEFGFDDGWG